VEEYVNLSNYAMQAIPTPRELECLRLAAEGATNDSIADELGVSVKTVNTLLHHLYGRLGAMNRASAIAMAFRRGYLT
jgi:DNA-binding CsgD family transcriptional regulator